MKKLGRTGKIKTAEMVYLTAFLLIVLSTLINVIVNLIIKNGENMYVLSIALIIQFTSRFIHNYNPFEIIVVLSLLCVTVWFFLILLKSYYNNYKNKCFYTMSVSVWCLLISIILPVLLDADFIGNSQYSNTLISCILFGLAFSVYSSVFSLLQLWRYTKYLDKKYPNSKLAVSNFWKKYHSDFYSSLKKPLLMPSVYAIIPLVFCSFLIYFGVKSVFLTCFIYAGFGIGLIYHIVCNISEYRKLKIQKKSYKIELISSYINLSLCYFVSLLLLIVIII